MTAPARRLPWGWIVGLIVVLAVVGLGTRFVMGRQAERVAVAAPPASPPVLELTALDVVRLRELELTRTLEVTGGLKAISTAYVKARVAAELKTLSVREGDTVRAGQVIAELDRSELDWRLRQAEQTAQASRAQLDIARRTLENNRALVAQGFISATALETSVATEAAAQATLNAALAGAELARKARADAVVTAPIGGIVAQRLVQPGERVSVDTRIVEIVDLSKLELEAAIAPEDVTLLRPGAPARLRVDGLAEPVTATVVRINPSAQGGSRSVMAYLSVEPNAALRQGLFASGRISLATQKALAVPVDAVRIDGARPYVLELQGERVRHRTVTLGLRGEAEGRAMVAIEPADGAPLPASTLLLSGAAGLVRDGTAARAPGAAAAAADTSSTAR